MAIEQTEEQRKRAFEDAGIDPITMASLTPAPLISIPNPPTLPNLGAISAGAISGASYEAPSAPAPDPAPTTPIPDSQSRIESILAKLGITSTVPAPPIDYVAERQKIREQEQIEQKQKAYSEASAKLAGLTAQQQALQVQAQYIPEAMQQQAEGRGITAGGLAPLTAGELRKNALAMLPITQQILSASAEVNIAKGNYDLAIDNVNQILELTQKTRTDQYNYQNDLYERAKEIADADDRKALEQKQAEARKAELEARDFDDLKKIYIQEAIKSQDFAIASKMATAKTPEELSLLAGRITPTMEKPTTSVIEVDGKKLLINNQTGETIKDLGITGEGEIPAVSAYQEERASRTVQSVEELLIKAKANPGIFGKTAALPIPDFLRSTAFRNFETELDTLKANIAFGELTAMREASKTGGALGQVSDREGQLLQSALGGLSMRQSPANFQAQLTKIKDSINRWRKAMGVAPIGNIGRTVTAPDGTQVIITD